MELRTLIESKVHSHYWHDDLNCAVTTLKILADIFGIVLSAQVIDSAIGMNGAGKYGAQCGLVEGSLMFLGILGKKKPVPEKGITDSCYHFTAKFDRRFGSLLCRELRPEGFTPENPPHLCEKLTQEAILFAVDYIFRR